MAKQAVQNLTQGSFSILQKQLALEPSDSDSCYAADEEGIYCTICLIAFRSNDEVCELKCNKKHIFHTTCITDWLKKRLSCPLCRQNVDIES